MQRKRKDDTINMSAGMIWREDYSILKLPKYTSVSVGKQHA